MRSLEENIKTYFGAITEDELQTINSYFKKQTIYKGESILNSGDICKQMVFIQRGLLRMYMISNGKEVTQWISTTGFFSTDLSSFMFNVPSRWTIRALEDTEVYAISKRGYDRLGIEIPRWNELEKLFLIRCFTILEDRIFSHLSLNAEERYRSFFEQNKDLFNQVPLQYIASMLGMTPETFSRIRKKQLL